MTLLSDDMEELTLSSEESQNLDDSPHSSLSSLTLPFSTSNKELQVEDNGTASTDEEGHIIEENQQYQDPVSLCDSKTPCELPPLPPASRQAETTTEGATQSQKNAGNVKDFKARYDEQKKETFTTSTATETAVAEFSTISCSTSDNGNNGEWVLNNNNSIPELPNNESWVVPLLNNPPSPPGVSSTAHSNNDMPYEANVQEPFEADAQPEGSTCQLVIPPVHWGALRQLTDNNNKIVLPYEKPFKPPADDSSEHSSDTC